MVVPHPILYALYIIEASYRDPISLFARLPVTSSTIPDDYGEGCEAEYHAYNGCFGEPHLKSSCRIFT